MNDHVSGATQGQPDIAVDPLGNAMSVWTDNRNGSDDIFSAVHRFRTHDWSNDLRADDGPAGTLQRKAVMAIGPHGRAIVVWVDDRGGDRDLYWAERPAGAGSWTPHGRVNYVTVGDQVAPDLVFNRSGDAFVVWEDHRSGGNADIYSAILPAGSFHWSVGQMVNDDPAARQVRPALAVSSDGTLYAVWADDRGGNLDIRAARRIPGGLAWSGSVRVNDVTAAQQTNPDVAVDGLGSVHAVWEDYRNGLSDPDIYSSLLPAGSSSWHHSKKVNDDAGHAAQRYPAIATTRHGSTYAVWVDERRGNPDIYFSSLRPGKNWNVNTRLNDDPGNARQDQPTIATDANGNAYVVWRDYRNASTRPDIYFTFLFSPERPRLYLPLMRVE